jgi:hypothetical protein
MPSRVIEEIHAKYYNPREKVEGVVMESLKEEPKSLDRVFTDIIFEWMGCTDISVDESEAKSHIQKFYNEKIKPLNTEGSLTFSENTRLYHSTLIGFGFWPAIAYEISREKRVRFIQKAWHDQAVEWLKECPKDEVIAWTVAAPEEAEGFEIGEDVVVPAFPLKSRVSLHRIDDKTYAFKDAMVFKPDFFVASMPWLLKNEDLNWLKRRTKEKPTQQLSFKVPGLYEKEAPFRRIFALWENEFKTTSEVRKNMRVSLEWMCSRGLFEQKEAGNRLIHLLVEFSKRSKKDALDLADWIEKKGGRLLERAEGAKALNQNSNTQGVDLGKVLSMEDRKQLDVFLASWQKHHLMKSLEGKPSKLKYKTL